MLQQTRFGVIRTALAAVLIAVAATSAAAANLDVVVLDPDGNPVPDVVVYVDDGADHTAASGAAVMDQRDTRFVPHILLIQRGTSVEFPNSDVVAHHVYSFSKPNDFVLPLYKGDPHDPVSFEHDGVVILGCNIHDHMLAYIVVVETDKFGLTQADGSLQLPIDEATAEFEIGIWSPRIRDRESALKRTLPAHDTTIVFQLEKKLRPPHDPGSEALQWSEY